MFYKVMMWLKALWFDERAEDDPNVDPNADATDTGGDPNVDINADPNAGKPVAPKYGDFGDNPTVDQIFEALNKTKGDFDNFRNKSHSTERNLATVRRAIEASGLVYDEEGNLLRVAKPAIERKSRFGDAHKTLFDEKVLEAIRFLAEDVFDEKLDGREKDWQTKTQQARQFSQQEGEAVDLMFSYFPQLEGKWDRSGKSGNDKFDKAFHDKVYEVWQENPEAKRDPRGQLLAALRVAKELNILPQAIQSAEKKGYEKGKEDKKILGPAGGRGAGQPGVKGTLSREEYLKLSEEERTKYDKQQAGL